MKKTISLIVALVMVFTMCMPAFAIEKPTGTPADATELGAYYAEKLNAEDADISAIAAEIVADFQSGVITTDTALGVFAEIVKGADSAEKAEALLETVVAALEDLGITIPDVSIPDVSIPDVSIPDISDPTLPDDDIGDNSGSDFLDTVLGILGTIGDMIFGPSDDDDDNNNDDDNTFNDNNTNTSDSDDLVSDTGDTTAVSVAAVALAAGAALVLTRKKSDEE